ncbi:hypothetical protein [Ktedonobacter racemifer]|uniref:hypothetical protein n=1 Tax=Ktedonobacter racemifer TaxID=363277 RepID=UPI0012F89C45|nr:hypothetical protein [Ktedonobacter racemifer]
MTYIEPVKSTERHAYLFDWHPNLPAVSDSNQESYDKALDDLRRACVLDTLEQYGIDGIIRMAEKSKLPRLVGMTVANVGGQDLTTQVLPGLAAKGSYKEIAVGWVSQMREINGCDWAEHTMEFLTELSDEARITFYLSLPIEPHTWTLVASDSETIQNAYYQSVPTWGVDPIHATTLAKCLLERGRPWSAIDLLAFCCHGNNDAAKPPADIIEQALRAALDPGVLETPQPGSLTYDLSVLLDNLESMGVAADVSFELEWQYFPLLQHTRAPRAVYARIASNPQLFVEAVLIASGKETAMNEADSTAKVQRRSCYLLLHSWRGVPGVADNNIMDGAVLRTWVNEVRRLFAEHDCIVIGDEYLGRLLSGSPPGIDGIWPAEPIRDLLEDLAVNKDIENGLLTGKFYSRGVTWRGVYDGGKQEAVLANQFNLWAEQVEDRWPRTGEVLRILGDGYARDARQADVSAERRADTD